MLFFFFSAIFHDAGWRSYKEQEKSGRNARLPYLIWTLLEKFACERIKVLEVPLKVLIKTNKKKHEIMSTGFGLSKPPCTSFLAIPKKKNEYLPN